MIIAGWLKFRFTVVDSDLQNVWDSRSFVEGRYQSMGHPWPWLPWTSPFLPPWRGRTSFWKKMKHHSVMLEKWRTLRFRLAPTQPPLWSHKSRSTRTNACGFQCKGHATWPENQQSRSYKNRLWPNSFALSLHLIKHYKPWFATTLGI